MASFNASDRPQASFVLRFWIEGSGPERFWRGSLQEVSWDGPARAYVQDAASMLALIDRVLRERSGIGLSQGEAARAPEGTND